MTPGDSLHEAALGRLAAQWAALGGQLDAPAQAEVVDLEALLVATARLAPGEPRIAEVALAWSVRHGSAINGARLRRVAVELGVSAEVTAFVLAVRNAGGPPWPMPQAGEDAGGASPWDAIDPRPGLVVVRDLAAPARLVWRLRAGFGVNARADILAVLLAAPTPLSIADLAARVRFGKRAVAGAVADMALAGLLDVERVGNANRVRLSDGAPVRAWQPGPAATARDEASLWRCVLAALDLHDRSSGAPDTVRAVEGRVATDALRAALAAARLPKPDTTVLGVAFGSEIDRWIGKLAVAIAP